MNGGTVRGELLLVDNDVTIGELVAFVLRRAGFGVRTATSFALARAALAHAPCDLVLSDVDLGAESALVELPRLAEEGLLPPTLVVSGYLDPEKRAWLGTLPQVVGFLDKPFDPLDLEREVAAALGEAQRRGAPRPGAACPAPWPEDDDGWVEIGGSA
jgi:DNA-binding NtrC family response regulator